MNIAMISFAAATILVCRLPILLPITYLGLLVPLCIFGLHIGNAKYLYGFVLGVLWTTFIATNQLDNRLPEQLQGKEVLVRGTVASLPKRRERGVNFNFAVAEDIPTKLINVTWYYRWGKPPKAAEFWSLKVKLNRPRGQVNPSLFDYEAWLLSRGIGARGYVVNSPQNYRINLRGAHQSTAHLFQSGSENVGHPNHSINSDVGVADSFGWRIKDGRYWHHHLRQKIKEIVFKRLPDDAVRGLIIGLLIGESDEISKDVWQALSHTGTNHLLIISGLHVGLVFGFAYWALARLVRANFSTVKPFVVIGAAVFTICYGCLAGLGLPVQRALVMILTGALVVLIPRAISVWSFYCLSLFAVLLVNPFASLNAGFWLSFSAVGSLILGLSGRTLLVSNTRSKIRSYLASQLIVFITMTPVLICWVMQASLISFFVNLVAIPFVGGVLIPGLLLCLPILLFEIEQLYICIDFMYQLVNLFSIALDYFAHYSLLITRPFAEPQLFYIALFGGFLLLLPRGFVPRWPGLILLVLSLASRSVIDTTLKTTELVVRIVDVGQGLSVVFKSPNGTVVYDAGPRYSNSFDAGKQIVAPTVKLLGARYVDKLVVSHSDLDHAGGVDGLRQSIAVHSVVEDSAATSDGCRNRLRWHLDDVVFEIIPVFHENTGGEGLMRNMPNLPHLEPVKPAVGISRNDASCVMLVRRGNFAMLLPGDIERGAENRLLSIPLPSIDVMISPHHGSLSSSSPAFLNHVAPRLVVVSAGYLNRFGHPHPRVLARYDNRGMTILNTASSGAITLRVDAHGQYKVEEARKKHRRFWYD